MKNILIILTITTLLTSCNLFINKEKKAIEVCQKAKVQFQSDNVFVNVFLNAYGLGTNATWLDFANIVAKQDPNIKYDWHAKITDDNKFYIVDFTDPDGWGHRWEVDIEQQIVKSINQNEYLTRKYGLSRFGGNEDFEVTKVVTSELKLDKHYNYYDNSNSSDVSYVIKASVLNKMTKTITSATIDGKLILIFKDKTITGESNYESGFKSRISENKPWEPNTTREFYIKTKGIEKIYLNYVPEYVVFDISLKAEDPIGFSFDKDIADMDLIENWKKFKDNPRSSTSNDNTNKSSPTLLKRNEYQINEPTVNAEEGVDEYSEDNSDGNIEN
jgi:hypothetical protein